MGVKLGLTLKEKHRLRVFKIGYWTVFSKTVFSIAWSTFRVFCDGLLQISSIQFYFAFHTSNTRSPRTYGYGDSQIKIKNNLH